MIAKVLACDLFALITGGLNDLIVRGFDVGRLQQFVETFEGVNFVESEICPMIMFLNKNPFMHIAIEERHTSSILSRLLTHIDPTLKRLHNYNNRLWQLPQRFLLIINCGKRRKGACGRQPDAAPVRWVRDGILGGALGAAILEAMVTVDMVRRQPQSRGVVCQRPVVDWLDTSSGSHTV